MADIVQRLRMQNIFGNQQPIGMPDFESGSIDPMAIFRKIRGMQRQDQIQSQNMAGLERSRQGFEQERQAGTQFAHSEPLRNRVAEIGAGMVNPAVQPGMRHIVNVPEPMNDYQKAIVNLRRDELGQRGAIASERADVSRGNTDVARQRASIADFRAKNPGLKVLTPKGGNIQFMNPISGEVTDSGIPTGTMSEDELQEMRGSQAMEQINRRGEISTEQIGQRGEEQRKTLGQTGEQNLAAIAARLKGQGDTIQPTQERVRVQNEIAKLTTTKPELAKLIVTDPNGVITISEQATPAERSAIEASIYGKGTGQDITLKPQTDTGKKTEEKPKAGQVKSKYAVTVK